MTTKSIFLKFILMHMIIHFLIRNSSRGNKGRPSNSTMQSLWERIPSEDTLLRIPYDIITCNVTSFVASKE